MNEQQKIAQVLTDSANALRTMAVERDQTLEKNAALQRRLQEYERRTRCEKVAAMMHQKGINTDVNFQDLVEDLEKKAMEGKLDTIREAVDMVGPDMSVKTASIHEQPAGGETDFERFLIGGIG